ncbi:MAG: polyprenyl diphosphate synthase [Dehalococcoidales bacterium]|nr:polyprenyl diphosphate synthase [Dehalococcoidales bacterium]
MSEARPPEPTSRLPRHVAIVMDGNGRWAAERGLPRIEGHRRGLETASEAARVFIDYGIPYLTLYAFSTENWKRPPTEVLGLFSLMVDFLDKGVSFALEHGIRFQALGHMEELPPPLQKVVSHAVEATRGCNRLTASVCLNYGARAEMLHVIRGLVLKGVPASDITEAMINAGLYTAGMPDPDLIIRTGGEQRLSNFLLWQAAYAEFYFTDTLWPDFDRNEIQKALENYSSRQRRFGAIK